MARWTSADLARKGLSEKPNPNKGATGSQAGEVNPFQRMPYGQGMLVLKLSVTQVEGTINDWIIEDEEVRQASELFMMLHSWLLQVYSKGHRLTIEANLTLLDTPLDTPDE